MFAWVKGGAQSLTLQKVADGDAVACLQHAKRVRGSVPAVCSGAAGISGDCLLLATYLTQTCRADFFAQVYSALRKTTEILKSPKGVFRASSASPLRGNGRVPSRVATWPLAEEYVGGRARRAELIGEASPPVLIHTPVTSAATPPSRTHLARTPHTCAMISGVRACSGAPAATSAPSFKTST